ncbi:lysophosphatidic acid receptor 5-like [Sinocyclocheilus anshuiensis]|uniref:Lysophosphatidic acid receptor 5-like n=1 Tax=Sinocyclocheilus anshuiensis TaxID=1608454 RepID=A0A671P5M9_9TELE|nr:PREDICTED: lysophosphatidic acid receptor 5-like [Sinocyclocheilus anshuiensis]
MCSNGTNSCITTALEPSNRYLASAVVYGLVLAVGLPLNTLSLWILLRTHGVRSPCAVLMVNLAVSDLFLALSLPLRVYFYATLRWPFGAATCTVALMVFRVNIRTSCIFITLISVDRMIAVACPLRSRSLRTSGCALKCCVVVWILITILCIPEIIRLYGALKGCPNIPCFEIQALSKSSRVFPLSQAIFLLVLLLVNIVSTVVVVSVLRKRPSAGAAKVNNKMNVILIFVVNMLVFIIFFLPFTLQLLTYNESNCGETILALVCLASVNCCLDPLIYYFSLDSFWQDKGKRQTDVGNYSLSRSTQRS